MSRSYKKQPYYTDGHPKSTKIKKRLANKKVRKYHKKIEYGNAYKKIFCSWDIHDYKIRWTWKEALESYNDDNNLWKKRYPNLKDFYRYWKKYHKNK